MKAEDARAYLEARVPTGTWVWVSESRKRRFYVYFGLGRHGVWAEELGLYLNEARLDEVAKVATRELLAQVPQSRGQELLSLENV